MTQVFYIGTNTKMYKTIVQTRQFLEELGELTNDISSKLMLFVIPSFTTLDAAKNIANRYGIHLGAQNMCWEDEGQFTGEISPIMLREVGAEIAEIGHSERRHVLGEDDEMIRKKVEAALRHGIRPLLCIGETQRQKELGIADEVLRIQIKTALNSVEAHQLESLMIAYEPVWAIGVNGKPASSEYADQRHAVIKQTLRELFGKAGENVQVLYGGSVHIDNAEALASMKHIDGLFVGRSAWDANNFNKLIRIALAAHQRKLHD